MAISVDSKQNLKVKTLIKCMQCDYTQERDFQVGDFVLKLVGNCPKDNGPLYIAGIYAEAVTSKK
ncbi:hypothetical protein L3N51_00294 [Metallosphaera sp. J1]|uniref:hypothetical protein n=1 Tax=Metallosphaera TaxID=41980 RepID=UPI002102C50E|nr:hypothetical protein [Metallosphaera javensis (ex Hofmann et al. 2022)]BCS91826.1 MAG: hypothetical protein MjAS7_0434 [Metallosphaera javensis (ex Sakai et al. 2022)]